jgi:hypothetical protein
MCCWSAAAEEVLRRILQAVTLVAVVVLVRLSVSRQRQRFTLRRQLTQ